MKPLEGKNYGSIPHLIGSVANGDKFVTLGQHKIATEKTRDKHDTIIVEEKIDGSNVGILKRDEELIPITRSGNLAKDSRWLHHRIFHNWVMKNSSEFEFLRDNERLCGEWLIKAHGTIYDLIYPFIAFDLIDMSESDVGRRLNHMEFYGRLPADFPAVYPIYNGHKSVPISYIMDKIGNRGGYRAKEMPEGAVWRVERNGEVDFLAKYLRRQKGKYLEDDVWNVDIKKFMKELPWRL